MESGASCTRNGDCDDGIFCNGVESCRWEGEEGRCVIEPACAEGEICSESAASCRPSCDVTEDADGDGSIAIECGGGDCDDLDVNRYPGNAEVCDVDYHDEDCDPSTYGVRDDDGDGYPDASCCNGNPVEDEEFACGTDCNDQASVIHPASQEVCNGIDDDCNGEIDDGLLVECYADLDNDGVAAAGASGQLLCWDDSRASFGFCPPGSIDVPPEEGASDCDDLDPETRPGADDPCDGVDQNCDGTPEPTIECFSDNDSDGYAPEGANIQRFCPDEARMEAPVGGCPLKWTALSPGELGDGTVDCCDLDARAVPGANSWQSSANACGSGDFNCDGDETPRPTVPGCLTLDENACQRAEPGPLQGGACFAQITHRAGGCGWDPGQNSCRDWTAIVSPRACR